MACISRILVATDFSGPSEHALAYAFTLAPALEASVHLLHVFEDPYVLAGASGDVYTALPAEFRDELLTDARQRLQRQFPADARRAFNGSAEIVTGRAAKTIVDYAADHGADLIVMGTHGRGGVAHVLLGSVAERVVRTAPMPVVTTRDGVTGPPRHILVPTDFSVTAHVALPYGQLLAERFDAQLHLLHVLDDAILGQALYGEAVIPDPAELRDAMLAEATRRLRQEAPPFRGGLTSDVIVGHGPKTIARYAREHAIDLIVMGTHGRNVVSHALLGSVAEKLVRTAPCPVLTVRQPHAAPTGPAFPELDARTLPA